MKTGVTAVVGSSNVFYLHLMFLQLFEVKDFLKILDKIGNCDKHHTVTQQDTTIYSTA